MAISANHMATKRLLANHFENFPEMGVNEGGFITTVQPTAIAGATLRAIIAAGKFHGAIIPATPIGCLILTIRLQYGLKKSVILVSKNQKP